MTTTPDLAGMCGLAGCPHPSCGAVVTFAAQHPLDHVLTEFTVEVCAVHRAALSAALVQPQRRTA